MNGPRILRSLLLLVTAGIVYILFHLKGNTTDVATYSSSAFRWMVKFWYYTQGFGGTNYIQGWLIPVVSLWFAWRQRAELSAAAKQVSCRGLAVVVLALFLHWVGVKSQQTRLSLIAFILLIWGIPFYLYGWPTARLLVFPAAFLLFCVPLNFFDSVLFPLRILSVRVAAGILNGLGLSTATSGSAIYLAGEERVAFEMAGAASSIQMVLAVAAFAAALGQLFRLGFAKHAVLVALSLPMALLSNTARTILVCLTAEGIGPDAAGALYEHGSSILTFSMAFALVLGTGILLRRYTAQRMRSWKNQLTAPS